MTQEELDALIMSGDLDSENSGSDVEKNPQEQKNIAEENQELNPDFMDPKNYKTEAGKKWPPPPPTDEHKVVHQLDDVTKDSEVKATQIFDQLDYINNQSSNIAKTSKEIEDYLQKHQEIFEKLSKKFPQVDTFQTSLEETAAALKALKSIDEDANSCLDSSMQAMEIMQFQDIHRQKIERVINVMRALAQYMNSLFEGKVDDAKRAASAIYIAGDNKDDIANEDDIEALIASFGKK